MLLLLVRHALAAERDDEKFPDDSVRPLVDKGRKVQRRISRHLASQKLIPSTILSSPWRRAWQTAAILAEETGVGKKKRQPCEALAQDPNLMDLARAIGPREPDEIVALVGHEPWIGELGALLLAGVPSRPAINFPKSGVMGISAESISPSSGMLRFFLTPGTI